MNKAIILLSHGNFGGAQKRFLNLFFYLNANDNGGYYFLTTDNMFSQIKEIFPEKDLTNIIIVKKTGIDTQKKENTSTPKNTAPGIISFVKRTLLYKIYYFFKLKARQKETFKSIDAIVSEKKIGSILAVYTGVLPLYFYFKRKDRPIVIFSNMDSWFTHLSNNTTKDWYKKYDLFNYAHKKADHIDILSPFILEGLINRGIEFDKNRVSITACSFIDQSKTQISSKDKTKVVFSGRLEKDKNPILYTEACLLLAPLFPMVEFHIIGNGRLLDEIKEMVSDKKYPNITVHGFLKDPNSILKNSMIFVSIQSTNNYPSQSILEAMACGNAIIASDVGDTRIFINEDNGILIDLSLTSLKNSMEFLIRNPEIALAKGKQAYLTQKEYTIERAASYYKELFKETIPIVYANS